MKDFPVKLNIQQLFRCFPYNIFKRCILPNLATVNIGKREIKNYQYSFAKKCRNKAKITPAHSDQLSAEK